MPEPDTEQGREVRLPGSVEKNAEFQAANKKCQSILRKGFRRTSAGSVDRHDVHLHDVQRVTGL